eukprot:8868138-Prorocentrum_lima.AAC.1
MDKRTLRLKTRLKEEELPALEAQMSDSAIQFGDSSSDCTSNQCEDVCARRAKVVKRFLTKVASVQKQ